MLSIVALNKFLIRILFYLVNGMFTNNQLHQKCVISAFVISQQIKKV